MIELQKYVPRLTSYLFLCLTLELSGCTEKTREAWAPTRLASISVSASTQQQPVSQARTASVANLPSGPANKKVPQRRTPEPIRDGTWYLLSPKLNACVIVSETFDGVNSPEELIEYMANKMHVQFVRQSLTDDLVLLKDPTGENATIGMARGNFSCDTTMEFIFSK